MSLIASLADGSGFSLSNILTLADTLVSQVAIGRFYAGLNPAVFWVYWGVAWMLFMSWCSAAWVVYQTVTYAISWTETSSFYASYYDWSSTGNLMYLWELLAVSSFLLWSLWTVILSTWAGSEQWKLMDDRVAEAATNVASAETPLRWNIGILHFLLATMTGITTTISGVALGDAAVEMVAWFDKYNTKCEATEDGGASCGNKNVSTLDTLGTAAGYDILAHLIAVFYGTFVLSAISLGGFIFMLNHVSLDDDWTCDIDDADFNNYAGAFPYILGMTSFEDCMAKMDNVFPFFDDNGDGFLDRCEDAKFQHAIGESKEFAIKFSSYFTKETVSLKVCEKRWPYIKSI